jgi:hypothetical protein
MTDLKSAYKEMSKPPRMIQVVLSDESRNKLLNYLNPLKYSNKSAKPDQYCHHITLAVNPNQKQLIFLNSQIQENQELNITCFQRAWSDSLQIEAVLVEIPYLEVPWQTLHITTSMEHDKPALSNQMIKSTDKQTQQINLELKGTVKYYK